MIWKNLLKSKRKHTSAHRCTFPPFCSSGLGQVIGWFSSCALEGSAQVTSFRYKLISQNTHSLWKFKYQSSHGDFKLKTLHMFTLYSAQALCSILHHDI